MWSNVGLISLLLLVGYGLSEELPQLSGDLDGKVDSVGYNQLTVSFLKWTNEMTGDIPPTEYVMERSGSRTQRIILHGSGPSRVSSTWKQLIPGTKYTFSIACRVQGNPSPGRLFSFSANTKRWTGSNYAQNKVAKQKTTQLYDLDKGTAVDKSKYGANFAVDGRLMSGLSVTEFTGEQWWKVDLGVRILFRHAVIYVRNNQYCGPAPLYPCSIRLNHTYFLTKKDGGEQVPSTDSAVGWRTCFYTVPPLGDEFSVICTQGEVTPLTRQFAILSKNTIGNVGVALREVEVYGYDLPELNGRLDGRVEAVDYTAMSISFLKWTTEPLSKYPHVTYVIRRSDSMSSQTIEHGLAPFLNRIVTTWTGLIPETAYTFTVSCRVQGEPCPGQHYTFSGTTTSWTGSNYARRKAASQKTTQLYDLHNGTAVGQSKYGANVSVDGSLTSGLSVTEFTGEQWWKVDLGVRILFRHAVIYVRDGLDCGSAPSSPCSNRLNHTYFLTKKDGGGQTPNMDSGNGWSICFYTVPPLGDKYAVVCAQGEIIPLTKQFAILSKNIKSIAGVALREVEVYGYDLPQLDGRLDGRVESVNYTSMSISFLKWTDKLPGEFQPSDYVIWRNDIRSSQIMIHGSELSLDRIVTTWTGLIPGTTYIFTVSCRVQGEPCPGQHYIFSGTTPTWKGSNYALNKVASQKSRYTKDLRSGAVVHNRVHEANVAVDGSLTSGLSVTEFTGEQWWKVDLGVRILFRHAVIYVRDALDCGLAPFFPCSIRLNHTYFLTKKDGGEQAPNTDSADSWSTCFDTVPPLGDEFTVTCTQREITPLTRQFAILSKNKKPWNAGVALREVEIYGYDLPQLSKRLDGRVESVNYTSISISFLTRTNHVLGEFPPTDFRYVIWLSDSQNSQTIVHGLEPSLDRIVTTWTRLIPGTTYTFTVSCRVQGEPCPGQHYTFNGTTTAWTEPELYCETPPIVENAEVGTSRTVKVGESVLHACKKGYHFTGGDLRLDCVLTEDMEPTWTGSRIVCSKVTETGTGTWVAVGVALLGFTIVVILAAYIIRRKMSGWMSTKQAKAGDTRPHDMFDTVPKYTPPPPRAPSAATECYTIPCTAAGKRHTTTPPNIYISPKADVIYETVNLSTGADLALADLKTHSA